METSARSAAVPARALGSHLGEWHHTRPARHVWDCLSHQLSTLLQARAAGHGTRPLQLPCGPVASTALGGLAGPSPGFLPGSSPAALSSVSIRGKGAEGGEGTQEGPLDPTLRPCPRVQQSSVWPLSPSPRFAYSCIMVP